MLNHIRSNFTIKDLENLSGIKAHTLRIWEKRYELFSPNRDDNNVRSYDLTNLQKLFNVVYLLNQGMKISHIAEMPKHEISAAVRGMVLEKDSSSYALNNFKLAMLNFDPVLFNDTYNHIIKEKTFKEVLYDVFFPMLYQIGLLWQTDTLNPSHEHFLSNLVKQKLLINIDKLDTSVNNDPEIYVLFLPFKEIHEIGLLTACYELKLLSKYVIYLGESIPVQDLVDISNKAKKINFVSYFTVYPDDENLLEYVKEFESLILNNTDHNLWVGGYKAQFVRDYNLPKVNTFASITELLKNIPV